MPATLKSRLPQIAASLRPRVSGAVKAGAEIVEAKAKIRAPDAPPIGQGLVQAIHTERRGPAEYAVVAGGSGSGDDLVSHIQNMEVFYGHMVEFGTDKAPAQPFLIPAAEESKEEVAKLVAASLRGL